MSQLNIFISLNFTFTPRGGDTANDTLDMMLIAVRPDLQGSGINAVVMDHIVQGAIRMGIRYAESGPTLETNDKVQAQWKFFEHEQHKRRRCYIKDLT